MTHRHPLRILALAILCGGLLSANPDALFRGNQFYETGRYADALDAYREALDSLPSLVNRYPELRMKIAYSHLQIGQYAAAATQFEQAAGHIGALSDYADYFALYATLQAGDTAAVIGGLDVFLNTHRASRLRLEADSVLADLHFRRGEWAAAERHYRNLLTVRGVDRGDVYARLIRIGEALGNTRRMQNDAVALLAAYPFHPRSADAYSALMRQLGTSALSAERIDALFAYLTTTGQYDRAASLLDGQQKRAGETEQIRWLRIRLQYVQNQYWAALQACKTERPRFRDLDYLREIDLHIARCNLRLGFTAEAIDAYDQFQQRFPRDPLAPEVLWVIAWLAEKEGHVDAARGYYQRLIRKYPRYEFAPEARFRMGLSFYSQDSMAAARRQWQGAQAIDRDDLSRERLQYWVAKSHLADGDSAAWRRALEPITAQPFDSYYTLKAFLLTRNTRQITQFVDSLFWEMHHNETSFLPRYLSHFEKPLLINEIFGEQLARRELNHLAGSLRRSDWELLHAFGEVNEHLRNFGKAYRIYRRVYTSTFSRKDWREWRFLVKNLYPLYFPGEVNEFARLWNLTPASIWAVIKKESAFEPEIMSYANAYGLMQIIPPTATRLSRSLGEELDDVRRLYEPRMNIKLGSFYLAELLKRYNGNLYYALAAYNAGEHRVDRWSKVYRTDDDDVFMENIEYEQTRGYVRGVMKFYWMYHLMLYPYEAPTDHLVSFPEKSAREPWFRETGTLE